MDFSSWLSINNDNGWSSIEWLEHSNPSFDSIGLIVEIFSVEIKSLSSILISLVVFHSSPNINVGTSGIRDWAFSSFASHP